MRRAIIRNLPAKTGRTIEDWSRLLRTQGPAGKRKQRIAWLQGEHGLGHGQASTIADWTDHPEVFEEPDPAGLVEAQYEGKDGIRPIFARLASIIDELGADVAAEPRKTYVAYARGRQFALLQPSSATRLDVGLVLPGAAETERLRPAGPFGSGRITHRVSLAHEDEIDAQLTEWLGAAYDAAAD
jgi:Domain of unknown function (DUF5655)/Domain of unknown function (DUF4287)